MILPALLLLLLVAAPLARGQSPPPAPDPPDPEVVLGSGQRLRLFPAGDVFPVYAADLHRVGNAVIVHFYTHSGVADSSEIRFALKAGGRFGFLRIEPATPGGRSWQVSVEAGFNAQFDSLNKADAVGWDGNYGVTVTTASSSPLSLKLGILHRSAHVGDEYAERTGRLRIDYTRAELALGAAWRLPRGLRAYGEGGYAHYQLTEEQRPWRVQGGLEWESARTVWKGRLAWYAAADLSATEERGWRLDRGVQAGVLTRSSGRTWRVGVEYYKGRPPLGEFFQDTEAHFSLGLWMDL